MIVTKQRGTSGGLCLYAIAGFATRRVKIGRANDVRRRLATLQSGSPDPLVLLAWSANKGPFEWMVHLHFLDLRTHGEWFAPSLTEEIATAIRFSTHRRPTPGFDRWVERVVQLRRQASTGRIREKDGRRRAIATNCLSFTAT